MDYSSFIESKRVESPDCGLSDIPDLHPSLFPFQRDITRWALRRGRACIFADCGTGKTFMQLEWARHIPGKVLILTPLAVAYQTVREAEKFGMGGIAYSRDGRIEERITVTNYERLDRFSPADFDGIILDESSILKSYSGKMRNEIIGAFAATPYRLACTATPAPNDYMELGNHAEFVGAMSRVEMLASFFIHDGGETQKWRIKGHADDLFWRWVCSWAVMLRKPSDLGYEDDGFVLPPIHYHDIKVQHDVASDGMLFAMEATDLRERQQARKSSIDERVEACANLVNASSDPWIVWCNLNDESSAATRAIPGAVEVKGSDASEYKERAMLDFSDGKVRVLVTKPTIAGFGMNWQHCSNVAFLGLSDSYEQYYQSVRRCWRFGQKREVQCYIITAQTEGAVVRNVRRKEADAEQMARKMVIYMHELNEANIRGTARSEDPYETDTRKGERWTLHLGDAVDALEQMEPDTIDYTIFSPPFASLYTYSASTRDMGNCHDMDEFMEHFQYLIHELYRVLSPGRLASFHCMNLPTSKCRDGFIGIRDFRGELIRSFEAEGFIFHSEVCIWKDPVTAMQRTKALGLLHKQLVKDSCMSRQGIPDYLVTMRKPGENQQPVRGELDHFQGDESTFHRSGRLSIDIWQRYASPVWMDINPSNTLQFRTARDEKDERHICPLQLDVIHRALQLWTNEGDLVLSPFAGIGSEGWEALRMGRRFVGVELKRSYWEQACKNLTTIESECASELMLV